MPSKRFASPARTGSTSGSGPASGSKRSLGTTSVMAPRRAPASRLCDSARRSTGIAMSGEDPAATSVTASRKAWASDAVSSPIRRSSRTSLAVSCVSCGRPSDIEQPPPLESATERELVRVLQIPPDRQPGGQPGDAQAHRLEQPREIGGSGLALEVRVRRQDDLRHLAGGEPRDQFAHPEVVRPDPLDRADRTAEHVVTPAELPGLLDRDDVLGLLDDAEDAGVATSVPADAALLVGRDVAAHDAEADLLAHLGEGEDEPPDVLRVGLQQVEGDALGTLRTDPGQPPEFVDEVLHHALVHTASLRGSTDGSGTRAELSGHAEYGIAVRGPDLQRPGPEVAIGEDDGAEPRVGIVPEEGAGTAEVTDSVPRDVLAGPVARPSEVPLEGQAPVERVEPADSGQHAVQPGELGGPHLRHGAGRQDRRLLDLRDETGEVTGRAVQGGRRGAAQLGAAQRQRLEDGLRQV